MNNRTGMEILLTALKFAADKHRLQRRKDHDSSPYINHLIAVAEVLSRFGVDDMTTLQAAILHDTIEDTQTTAEELDALFGTDVKSVVLEVTDDKRLPKEERKQRQIEHAPHLSERAKLVKIADKISNVREVIYSPPTSWPIDRRKLYLDWAEKVVNGCRGVNSQLEQHFDDLLSSGRAALNQLTT